MKKSRHYICPRVADVLATSRRGWRRFTVSIEARKASLSLGDRRVLTDIDLRIEAGEFFCLLGPSGAGKRRSWRVIAGLATPDAGDLLIDGSASSATAAETRGVGMKPR